MTTTEEKLTHAKEWMQRQVLEGKNMISQNGCSEEGIIQQIQAYFPPKIYIQFSENHVKELMGSEILFDVQSKHTNIDGSSIIIGYQKVFDYLVETSLIKAYRRYIKKYSGRLPSPYNTPLEKSLYQVCKQGYILSSGRLYELLKNMKLDTQAYFYEKKFREYTKDSHILKKYLLESDFFLHLEVLMKKKILGEKRHTGIISRKDTILAREKYIGNLKNMDSLLGLLAQI